MHAGLSQSYDKTERSARPGHSERANATGRLSRRSGVTRLQSPRCGRMPRDDASCRCLLTRRLGRTWKYRSNRLHELKASALGSERYIQSTDPQSSIPSCNTINQQRLTSQTTLLTFTHTHIHKSQYLISAIDQPQNPSHLNISPQQHFPTQPTTASQQCLPQIGNSISSTSSSPALLDLPAQHHRLLNQEPHRLLAGT